jgi:hypothetical protein
MDRGAWRSIEAVNALTGEHDVRLRLLIHGQYAWGSVEAVNATTGVHSVRLKLLIHSKRGVWRLAETVSITHRLDSLMLAEAVNTPKQQCVTFG